MRGLHLVVLLILGVISSFARTFSVTGTVVGEQKHDAIPYATVVVVGSGIGSITNDKGVFVIENLSPGKYSFKVQCLGYADKSFTITLTDKDITGVRVQLPEMSLALDEVTVTARRKADATTTYSIDRTALDHIQGVSISDITSLLPGEQTNKSRGLTSSQTITLRGTSQEMGNPDFGTAIEMDGVRLSGNSSVTGGTDTRNINVSNVERIDVISGVPSVEYGDFTNGIVKVITRKGKTPLTADISIRPHTQTYAIGKGVRLGRNGGFLNLSYERAKSIADMASPYTSYIRNAFGVRYSNTFSTRNDKQLSLDFGVNGNIGGMNTESDPDAFKDTYTKTRDNAINANLSFKYSINSPWLTDLRWGATLSYSDNKYRQRTNRSASAMEPSIHSLENGYFVASRYDDNPDAPIILLPTGYWYLTEFDDSKPLRYSAYLKARWSHRFGSISSNLLAGAEWKGEENAGRGQYYDDMRYAPTWREYRYDGVPMMNNISAYAEEEVTIPFSGSRLQVKAGVRSDNTILSGSEYGTVGSISPRFNVRYTFAESRTAFVEGITLRAGWGKAVKLPSFEILYPRPIYNDRIAFAPGSMSDGTAYYAYHTEVVRPMYNDNLRWQYNVMREGGADIRMKGMNLSLSVFYNTMYRPYTASREYMPFDYSFTDQTALNGCPIPSADRQFNIDQNTGVVTVSDKTGRHPSQVLGGKTINDFKTSPYYANGSSSSRFGIEWVLDFDKIRSINTSFRLDGKYYHYKGVDERIDASRSTLRTTDGQPNKYIGYYVGGASIYNGFETDRLNVNFTAVTHVPKIRMIFSLRLEGTFINTRQNLSEYGGGDRSFVIDSQQDNFPGTSGGSIYDGNHYVASYPLYYVSRDDMSTKVPFMEKYLWASKNDPKLYSDLSALVVKSSTGYMFREQGYTPYFSANINVTKEIGDFLTLSFFANNFFYSMQKVKADHTGTHESLYNSGRISPFNYGLSVKIKL